VEDLARARAEQAPPPSPPSFLWTPTAASVPPEASPTPIVPPLPTSPSKIPDTGEIEEKRGQERAGVVDWEKFLGVKLFAWVGGLALFLGIAFFIKYSFEHNLIPPAVRVALGCVSGIGLIVGGLTMRRKAYAVTSQTLCATGILTLYASSFAAHGVYHLLSAGPVFLAMSIITAGAFTLAVRLDARAVAVLGLVGGFLTPVVLSSGQDRPLALFGYIALIDTGLAAVALKRRWHFLFVLGAAGTALTELGWFTKFFEPAKAYTALGIFSTFCLFQAAGYFVSGRLRQATRSSVIACLIQAAVSFFAAFCMITTAGANAHPAAILALIFIAHLTVLAVSPGFVFEQAGSLEIQFAGGVAAFTALAVWLRVGSRGQDLYWAMGAVLLFALLHSVSPRFVRTHSGPAAAARWINLLPLGALVLMILLLFHLPALSFLLWPALLLLNLVLIAFAFYSGFLGVALGALLLSAIFAAEWILRVPRETAGGAEVLIVAIFGILFFAAAAWLCRSLRKGAEGAGHGLILLERYMPALSALLPFVLLCQIVLRLDLPNPAGLFGVCLVLAAILLWIGTKDTDELYPVTLASVLFVEYFWQLRFGPGHALPALPWYLVFHGFFMAHPFFFREKLRERIFPWATSAVAGPVQFYLTYSAAAEMLPEFKFMGLIPALLALPSVAALAFVLREPAPTGEQQSRFVAFYGGSALFFITLIFPIQFSHQWLTLGWALEGMALCWLYTRVPQRGLRIVGLALLVVSFIRLGLNPNVFSYYPRSQTRILNWYLYSYGIATLCLLFAGHFLAPPRHRIRGINILPLLYTLAAILAFMLLNIEIADFFANGKYLRFEFSGNFARDMSYSIAWGLFALALLLIGIWKKLAPVRYASLGLLGVTLLKLFLHDLSELGQLYRIGAFIGVAIILILASWFYQRFLASAISNDPARPRV
jgi:uncharacterized membrane protein